MDALRFLSQLERSPQYQGQMACVQTIRPRSARYARLRGGLAPPVERALASAGIRDLYVHQAQAIEAIQRGEHVTIVTGTASGKTLCYNLPVMDGLLEDPRARALYLFPTKALAQDQLKSLRDLAGRDPAMEQAVVAGTYDGDTPQSSRRRIRDSARIILSNPDMLHASVLPGHPRWVQFLSGLRYVVIDELHTYRGIFGSHVANVLRRLRRLCAFYGSRPQFITCSATIANPGELAEQLIGHPTALIHEDGSPRGTKYFVFWNPPETERGTGLRRSPNVEAEHLLVQLMEEGVASITFTRARVLTELIYRYARENLLRTRPELADRLRAYRGGYLASDRRDIERRLFSGELLAVTATSALELGIDLGHIDASILVGFPGTIASTWQQAGRAGRTSEESLVLFIAQNDPIDQFLVRHPEYLFEQTPEHAVIHPDNLYILAHHIMCAAAELPLRPDDEAFFGEPLKAICDTLAQDGTLRRIEDRWYWSSAEVPSRTFGLRTISDETFTIVDSSGNSVQTIGDVDGHRAFEVVHPEAVYLHGGEFHLVRSLDLEAKVATVERVETDYYTQAMVTSQIRVQDPDAERDLPGLHVSCGDVEVTRQVQGYTRFRLYTLENLGQHALDLPPRTLETRGMWFTFAPDVLAQVEAAEWLELAPRARPLAAVDGLRNVILAVLPMVAMCDRQDIGGIVNSTTLGRPALFIYDRYPGGLGFAQQGYECTDQLLADSLRLVDECPCENGCPSCIARPASSVIVQDVHLEGAGWAESKAATLLLLYLLRPDAR